MAQSVLALQRSANLVSVVPDRCVRKAMTESSLLNMAAADVIAEPRTISGRAKSDRTDWQKQRHERNFRLEAGSRYASGKLVPPEKAKALLEAVIRPGDRVCLEGDNQKQPDFLAEVLAGVGRSRIHDLHI